LIAFLLVRQKSLKKKLKQPVPDETATELMRDLLNGGAVAVVRVIDPQSIFLYSPKDRR
jgi:hypothetical protein